MIKNNAYNFLEKFVTMMLLMALFLVSTGGGDLLSTLARPLALRHAEAAATAYGKELRTAEFVLGGGSDNTVRASNVMAYAGATSWVTTKPALTTGGDVVTLLGTGIHVLNAQLDVSFEYPYTAAASVSQNRVFVDVEGSATQGTDVPVNGANGATPLAIMAGGTGYLRTIHDVTSFFGSQSDAAFNSGVHVLVGVAPTLTAGNRALTTAKLVVTYEVDIDPSIPLLVKTVHLPLASSGVAGNKGTRTTVCAAGATCPFTFDTSVIRDLSADANIVDAHVEFYAYHAGTVNSTFTLQFAGGAASPAYAWGEAVADTHETRVLWGALPTGGSNLRANTAQTLNLVNAAGGAALYATGGEVIITYKFNPTAPTQTETIRNFVDQRTTSPAAGANTVMTGTTLHIANNAPVVEKAWYRMSLAPVFTAATTMTVTHTVNGVSGTSQVYQFPAPSTARRSANTPVIIHSLTPESLSFSASTPIGGSFTFSGVGGSPVATEVVTTFSWSYSIASAQTKTALFAASLPAVGLNVGTVDKVRNAMLYLPERAAKTFENGFLEVHFGHSNTAALTISSGVHIGFGTSTTANALSIAEIGGTGGTYSFAERFYAPFAPADIGATTQLAGQRFPFTVEESVDVSANYTYFANVVVLTYSVAAPSSYTASPKQLRTAEFTLGGGTDTATRATGVYSYAGATWGSTKPAGELVKLLGDDAQVVNAYIDLSFSSTNIVALTGLTVTGDITGTLSGDASGVALYTAPMNQMAGGGSTVTNYYHTQIDATRLFTGQSSASLNNGVNIGIALAATGPTRALTTASLVVTYETTYTLSPMQGVKTVRFPLDSAAGSDTGSITTPCTATCNFTYNAAIADLLNGNTANILDVHAEITALANSAGNSTQRAYTVTIGHLSGSSAIFNPVETSLDSTGLRLFWGMPIGGNDFVLNTTRTLQITTSNTRVPLAHLGGEIVVTYAYSSRSTAQSETLVYPLGQLVTAPTVGATTTIGSFTPVLPMQGAQVQEMWLRVRYSPHSSLSATIEGDVGAAVSGQTYAAGTMTNRGGGETYIIHDLTPLIGSYATSGTMISAKIKFITASVPATAELFMTYAFDGSHGGTQARSVSYVAQQQYAPSTAVASTTYPFAIDFAHDVDKTFRAAELETFIAHGGATTITRGALFTALNGVGATLTEAGPATSYPYNTTMLQPLTATDLWGGTTMPSSTPALLVRNAKSTAVDYVNFSNVLTVTYEEQQTVRNATFTQSGFRVYADNGAITPVDSWYPGYPNQLGDSQEMTAANRPVRKSDSVRLRIALAVSTSTMPVADRAFQLQSALRTAGSCSAIAPASWINVGVGGDWSGFNNTGLPSSATIPTPLVAVAIGHVGELYSEDGLTATNPVAANTSETGDVIEYDWALKRNTALKDSDYCFRVVESSGKPLFGYDIYPVLHTAGYTPEIASWRWVDNYAVEANWQPLLGTGMNITPSGVPNRTIVNLRVALQDVANESGANERYAVQWSEDPTFTTGVAFADLQGNCTATSTFCYAAGASADDTSLGVQTISGTTLGRHNNATSLSTFSPAANSLTEMEYTLVPMRQRTGQTYYFRLYDVNRNIPLNKSATSYPSLTAEGATVNGLVSGVSAGVSIDGSVTTGTTTATTTPFGMLTMDSTAILAHQLSITTNAMMGYQVTMQAEGNLRDAYGDIIPSIVGAPNTAPVPWSVGCPAASAGCIGYHTSDHTLSPTGVPDRFALPDTWAEFATDTPSEVGFSDLPTNGSELVDVVYKIEPHAGVPPGAYSTNILYVITPVY
jgi:hypothetical protein